ncbi:aspartate kinase [Hymenobacter lutimineralis]|uniref:Aspartokinase n=1 Tax=Hymenobacter lutimineralis TaxID=2606448 RepID=A0A5D6UYR6_9BACT|nr:MULTISPECIES: aspartate kinase [Hymenobacter]QIX63194.1 aspartate kinase [Hymenobacter sp. BT18]TYZ07832.1 aspartate kinase [Hymenobacter lutimineralis]
MQEPHQLNVYKFGGASVKDAAAIRNLRHIVQQAVPGQLLIVVSAMGKTTNALEEIYHRAHSRLDYAPQLKALRDFHEGVAQELLNPAGAHPAHNEPLQALFAELENQLAALEPGDYDRQYDQVVSFGELLATRIVSQALAAQWLDCRPLVRTDHLWREGRLDWATTERNIRSVVPQLLQQGPVVTQGFLGGTSSGQTTTLGREGSDFTAAIFAHCLQARAVTIWKDVAGLLNADPKIFEDTVRYPEISYQETIEMAYYGASVIHPKTIKPLAVKRIPLLVKSFLDPTAEGTIIHDCRHDSLPPAFIRKAGQCLVSFESKDLTFISEENLEVIFGALAQVRLKIHLMQNSAISFSVCTDYSAYRLDRLLEMLYEQFTIHYNTGLELYTIKNYDAASIQRLTQGRDLLLEQRTRQTFQFVCRGAS